GERGGRGMRKPFRGPRVTYTSVSTGGPPRRPPASDEVDAALGRNDTRYAIVTRLLARPADPKKGSAEEIASLEIGQTHSFEFPQTITTSVLPVATSKDGPIQGILRLTPGAYLHFAGRLDYDIHASQFTAASPTPSCTWKTN